MSAPSTRQPRPKVSPWPFVGMGALACLLFLYAASLTYTPWWIVVPLLVVWLVLFVLGCRWFLPHPRRVVWTAVAGAIVWFVVTVLGAIVFGW